MSQQEMTNDSCQIKERPYIYIYISSSVMAVLLWDHSTVDMMVRCGCVGHKAFCDQCIKQHYHRYSFAIITLPTKFFIHCSILGFLIIIKITDCKV